MPQPTTTSPNPLQRVPPSLTILSAVVGTAFLTLAPSFVGAFVDEGALTVEQAGQVASSHLIGLAVGPLLALLSARTLRTRAWMTWGVVGAAAGHAACAFLRGFWPLVGAQFLAGSGAGLIYAAAAVLAAGSAMPERVYSQMFMAMMLFGALGFVALPLLLPHLGLALAFGLAATMAISLVPFLGRIPRYCAQESDRKSPFRWTAAPALLLLALFLYYVANTAIWAYLDRIGVNAGLAVTVVGMVLAISMLGSVVGGLLVARATRRFSLHRCLMGGIALIGAATALLFAPSSAVVFGVAVFLYLAAMTFTVPIFQGILAGMDSSRRCVLYGNLALMVGQGIAPAIGSQLIVRDSFAPLLNTSLGLFAAAAAAVVMADRTLMSKETT